MDEFPTSEDEFELMYSDDLDALHEQEGLARPPQQSQRSLNSSQPVSQDTSENVTPLENVQYDTQNSANTNKRSIEELFGDIDDILYDRQSSKRRKNNQEGEHCEELGLIEHILELRKLAKEKETIITNKNYTTPVDHTKHNLSYSVPNYPFVRVTNLEGERVYVRSHSEQYELDEQIRIIKTIALNEGLNLSKSLWQEAEELISKQTETSEPLILDNVDTNNEELWVDLYRPRKYFELLSDESTNRIMLKWIKLWDKVVFKRRPKLQLSNKQKNKFDLRTDLDEHGRPFHKVALLCGPPGLGKTTLAHMVAKHAGYNVVEVNASDDRSLDSFKTCLQNATQMRSVLDSERRPNCLVFDEIDGAPQSSIDFLVKFVTGGVTNKKKSKKEERVLLKRPIICICNDVYVPSLRPLRQIAFVINFPPTSEARLAERLMDVSKRQEVKTDLGAMLALAAKSQNDIRSCLSFLHFFKAQKEKPLMLSDVLKANVGQKDTQKGIFSVWQDIFLIERTNNKYASLSQRMRKVLSAVNSFGDYEKVAQGVFENYPNMKYKNSNMAETCLALEWFSFNDLVHKKIYSNQNYDLTRYLQYAFVVWNFVFAGRMWQKLQYPSARYEMRTKQNRQKAIIGELIRGIQPQIRSYVEPLSLKLDVLPVLPTILTPTFRQISLHLYTGAEKEVLKNVVGIMIDYNLTYVQERTPDGNYVYKLDPNISELVSFAPKRCLSYSNMQLIAQEIETTKMHRSDPVGLKEKSVSLDPVAPPAYLPNHLQRLKAKSVNSSSTSSNVVKDFFGRPITKQSSSVKVQTSRNDIWYQYKEGYNNAVRKKIKVSSLK